MAFLASVVLRRFAALGEEADRLVEVDPVLGPDAETGLGRPPQRLDVAQAAVAVLEVGLQPVGDVRRHDLLQVVDRILVGGAMAMFANGTISSTVRWLVLPGALLFYASDIFVARDRFVKPGFDNRLFGLPPYFAAQFMFAFSLGSY